MYKKNRLNSASIRPPFRRSRSTVERLEDRILLSAEPLLQFNRVDSEQALVVDNLAYNAQTRLVDPLDLSTISSIASLIDLTRPQSGQNSKFNWTGSTSSLLKLNSQLSALVLDLGEGTSQMSLSNDGNGMLSIGISVVVVVVAALNLVLDFDLIEQGAAVGAPKYLEWYSGFSLLVTLVWLYIEILRLLAKLNSRRD